MYVAVPGHVGSINRGDDKRLFLALYNKNGKRKDFQMPIRRYRFCFISARKTTDRATRAVEKNDRVLGVEKQKLQNMKRRKKQKCISPGTRARAGGGGHAGRRRLYRGRGDLTDTRASARQKRQ